MKRRHTYTVGARKLKVCKILSLFFQDTKINRPGVAGVFSTNTFVINLSSNSVILLLQIIKIS